MNRLFLLVVKPNRAVFLFIVLFLSNFLTGENNLYPTMGLAFPGTDSRFPTGKVGPLGAEHIQFEVFFHRRTSWIEVEWLVDIL
jgi:hypothetical protein